MGLATDLSALFKGIIDEHGSSAVLRERLLLVQDKMETLIKKVADLETENTKFKEQTSNLTAQLKAKTREEEFVEHRGAFFKRRPDGGYHLTVYCPTCHNSTGALIDEMPFACNKSTCKWKSTFLKGELDEIIKELV